MTASGSVRPEPSELLRLAAEIAAEAAELVAARRRGDITVAATKTTRTDVVTAADTEAERLIRDRIRATRGSDAILGEEGEEVTGSSGVRWLVDPIDGTVNYLYGHPTYAVSIAVELDDEPVAGVVAVPGLAETYTARRGGGARLNGNPITVSDCTELGQALVGTGFGYQPRRRETQARVLQQLIGRVRDVRRIGVAAVDLCYVACGRLDAMYERGLNPWDYAAGGLVATEAGGFLGGLRGAAVSPEFCLATTPGIRAELHELLVAADPLHD